jgi:hypothetical protein
MAEDESMPVVLSRDARRRKLTPTPSRKDRITSSARA